MQAARDVLGLTCAYVEAFEAEVGRLINTTMTDAAFHALTAHVFGTGAADAPQRVKTAERDRTESLGRLWADAATQTGIHGTAWAGYQAVVEYVDHHAPVRTNGDKTQARALRLLTSDAPTKIKHAAWSALAVTS